MNTHQLSAYHLLRPNFSDQQTEQIFRQAWIREAVEWLAKPVYYGIGTISIAWIVLDVFANHTSWLLSSLLRLVFAVVCFVAGRHSQEPSRVIRYPINLSLLMMAISIITSIIVALSSPLDLAYSYYPYSLVFQLICWGGITRMSLQHSCLWSVFSLAPMDIVLIIIQGRWATLQGAQSLLLLHVFWGTGLFVGWVTTWVFEVYGRRQFVNALDLQDKQKAIEEQYAKLEEQHRDLQSAHEEIEAANEQLSEAYRSVELRRDLEQKLVQAQLHAIEHENETKRLRSLAEANHQTEQLLENALDAVITIDADSIISAWNTQAEKTFGWHRTEALGKNYGN